MAYFELNIDYIVETYCKNTAKPELKCNGKCHLASQLALIKTGDTSKEASYTSLYEAFLPVYFQENTAINISNGYKIVTANNWRYLSPRFCFYANVSNPPPQAI